MNSAALDNWITGNWGEDSIDDEDENTMDGTETTMKKRTPTHQRAYDDGFRQGVDAAARKTAAEAERTELALRRRADACPRTSVAAWNEGVADAYRMRAERADA